MSSVAAAGLLILAISGSASGASNSGIRGVLLDTTCLGPCIACPAASPCPPSCPACRAQICPARPANAAIPCPAARSICAGCGTQPQPYTGPDAHVVVRRLANNKVVARRAPTDGKFAVRLGPGRYRVHGFVAQQCWQGTTVKVVVEAGSFTSVSIPVHNDCVLAPQRSAGG